MGVSTAAPHHHFESKDDLLDAVAADATSRLTAQMSDAWHADRPDGPEGAVEVLLALHRLGRAYIQFFLDHPVLFHLSCTHQRPSADSAAFQEMTHFTRQTGKAMVRARVIDPSQQMEGQVLIFCVMRGVVAQIEGRPRLVDGHQDPPALFDRLLEPPLRSLERVPAT